MAREKAQRPTPKKEKKKAIVPTAASTAATAPLAAAKEDALLFIAEDDIPFEEECIRTPLCLNGSSTATTRPQPRCRSAPSCLNASSSPSQTHTGSSIDLASGGKFENFAWYGVRPTSQRAKTQGSPLALESILDPRSPPPSSNDDLYIAESAESLPVLSPNPRHRRSNPN
ncbi:hypothetical protein BDR26DRAFT_1012176, partial [Obelidium mucronatum]